ncbi:Nitronate monooxygenase-domain-containing protein [Chytridium lagenaria]|nr:Nitronate monooxygenase-domain-containing protein [Chytridium lagenaria]
MLSSHLRRSTKRTAITLGQLCTLPVVDLAHQKRSIGDEWKSRQPAFTSGPERSHVRPPGKKLKTRLTEDLGIEHPIIQVRWGMQWVGTADMASAVSNGGGLGLITALTQPTPEALRLEIERCQTLTSNPFGVNLTFLPSIKPPPYAEFVSVIIDSGIKVVETAGNNPREHVVRLKEAGVKVIHKCTSIRHALSSQKLGVDYVSIDGFECAGHPGEDDVTGLILLALAARKLSIPYVASGGFGDGRGLAAALSLGAQGINMGTRFMCTMEAPVHPDVKMKIVQSTEKDTALLMRSLRNTARFFKNSVAEEVLKVDGKPGGAKFEDIKELVSGKRGKQVFTTGDSDRGVWTAGQIIGLIDDVPTCRELICRIVDEAIEVIERDLISKIGRV